VARTDELNGGQAMKEKKREEGKEASPVRYHP
jgi:hypothetical protein